MKRYIAALLGVLLSIGVVLPTRAAPASSPAAAADAHVDAVLAWNEVTAEATVRSGISPLFDPLHESRLYAMVHIAVHDALNGIQRRSRPYAVHVRPLRDASPEAAVATAAHDVLITGIAELPALFGPGIQPAIDYVDEKYTEALAAIPDGVAKRQGMALGAASAAIILARRADDGADTEFLDTTVIDDPAAGEYQWVDQGQFNVAPGWADVTPFVLKSGAQFRPGPPPALTSARYAADLNEMKEMGRKEGSSRDADQTEAAFFWFEASPMRWNRIARTLSAGSDLDLWQNARLLGLLNVALADGYIGNWDAKREYNRWRPETAIRQAGTDGNPLTEPEPGWTPLWGTTGATPEYDSGHAVEGAAAAVILASVFGDSVTFDVCSYSFVTPGQPDDDRNCGGAQEVVRTFHSFSDASDENAVSRIWIGWHFRSSVEAGQRHGTMIGYRSLTHFFRPIGTD